MLFLEHGSILVTIQEMSISITNGFYLILGVFTLWTFCFGPSMKVILNKMYDCEVFDVTYGSDLILLFLKAP